MEGAKESLQHPARKARRDANQGRGWYSWLARLGLLAKGVSFSIVGVLALELALGEGGKATSRHGALRTIADEPLGRVLLVLLALGFAAYAIWRFVQAFAEREDDSRAMSEAKKWAIRAGYVGRGLIYAGLAVTTARLLTGSSGGESQNQQVKERTAMVFDWPGGRWLVGIAGLAIAVLGVWNLYEAFARKFEDQWRKGQMSSTERRWGGRIGVAGHLARAIVFGLIGAFVTKAALDYDASDAIGLDGALQKLVNTNHGPYLLGVTAVGLICYAIYCLVDARYRDVSANAGT